MIVTGLLWCGLWLSACGSSGSTGSAGPEPSVFPTASPVTFGSGGATPLEPTPDPGAMARAEVDALPQGHMVFNPPATMKTGVMDQIALRIGRGTNPLTTDLPGSGTPQTQGVRVATAMSAVLSGDGAFDIQPLSKERQIIADYSVTPWDWNVTPVRSGAHYLDLSVSVLIDVPGYPELAQNVPILQRRVDVQVNVPYTLARFVGGNWQWLLTGAGGAAAAVLGALQWLARRRPTRRKKLAAEAAHRAKQAERAKHDHVPTHRK